MKRWYYTDFRITMTMMLQSCDLQTQLANHRAIGGYYNMDIKSSMPFFVIFVIFFVSSNLILKHVTYC